MILHKITNHTHTLMRIDKDTHAHVTLEEGIQCHFQLRVPMLFFVSFFNFYSCKLEAPWVATILIPHICPKCKITLVFHRMRSSECVSSMLIQV